MHHYLFQSFNGISTKHIFMLKKNYKNYIFPSTIFLLTYVTQDNSNQGVPISEVLPTTQMDAMKSFQLDTCKKNIT